MRKLICPTCGSPALTWMTGRGTAYHPDDDPDAEIPDSNEPRVFACNTCLSIIDIRGIAFEGE
jgi:hypothetical protein